MMTKRRKQNRPTLTSLHLPFDVVAEILCRLSVTLLIQLRCVCKSWNSLISGDSKFAKKHLRLSTSSHDRHHLIQIPTQSSNELVVCHSPISSIFNSASTITVKQFSPHSLGDILIKGDYGNRASTCDGILCFKIDNSLALLCNPFIRKFKLLPTLKFPDQLYTLYTLVYDRFTNNYKIIALDTGSRIKEVNVYTLGTNYWRRIQDFPGPDLIPRRRSGTFVNDSVNWVTYDSACRAFLIVSLNLEKESYQRLSLPVIDVQFRTFFMTLGILRGCLSLLFRRTHMFSDVWIMKEYGNEKSWIKLVSVPPMEECPFYHYTRALYISKDDQVLMEFLKNGKFNLVVYDFINNTFKIPKFQYNNNNVITPKVCVESLISPL